MMYLMFSILVTETSNMSPSCVVPRVSSVFLWLRQQALAQNLVLPTSLLGRGWTLWPVTRKLGLLNPKSGENIFTFPFFSLTTIPLNQSSPDLKIRNCPMPKFSEDIGTFLAFSAEYWRSTWNCISWGYWASVQTNKLLQEEKWRTL